MTFRFTIRDVLWLTVVVGVLCAWGIERRATSWQTQILIRDKDNLSWALQGARREHNRLAEEADILGKLFASKQQEVNQLRNHSP